MSNRFLNTDVFGPLEAALLFIIASLFIIGVMLVPGWDLGSNASMGIAFVGSILIIVLFRLIANKPEAMMQAQAFRWDGAFIDYARKKARLDDLADQTRAVRDWYTQAMAESEAARARFDATQDRISAFLTLSAKLKQFRQATIAQVGPGSGKGLLIEQLVRIDLLDELQTQAACQGDPALVGDMSHPLRARIYSDLITEGWYDLPPLVLPPEIDELYRKAMFRKQLN